MPAVMLDRDGVINRDSQYFIRRVDEWQPLPGSIEAIGQLSRAGWTIAVCTNQSGLARGYLDWPTLHAMHDKLRSLVTAHGGVINGIYVCPHGPDDGCTCRKPLPGLLQQAARELGFSLPGTAMIGDAARDLEAARRVGARPILVLTGKGQQTLEAEPDVEYYPDLAAAAAALLAESRQGR